MVFAARVAEGARSGDACTALDDIQRQKLKAYMGRFDLLD